MSTIQVPLFLKLESPLQTSSFGSDHQVLLLNTFYKTKQPSPSALITVALTNKYLCLCEETNSNTSCPTSARIKQICYIDFDLKFELVREAPTYDGTITNLGTPFSIQFDKPGYQTFAMYSDPETLLRWKDQLETMINRRGFHNLFKPMKKIGKGNFASVYLAESIEGKKMVAVKAFSKEATYSQDKGRQSLINEINLMRKLNQQNVLKLFSVFESQNSIYMTLEHLEGDQLFTKIQNKHNFTQQQIKQILSGLLKGLAHMHSKRIMHRDLKPENIMLRYTNSCEVVIVDFGLATWADQSEYLFVRCGTPGYVAPQIINIKDMKTRCNPISDIFSIGLIFHILLTGKSIFPGRNYNDVLNQNRNCDFNLQHFTYKALPMHAQDLLKKMLNKNPDMRITSELALQHPYFQQVSKDANLNKQTVVCSPLLQFKQNNSVPNLHLLKNKVSIASHLPGMNLNTLKMQYHQETVNKQNEVIGIKRHTSGMIGNIYQS